MRIGLDFDNTIVCYEKAVEHLAETRFVLPVEVVRSKLGLRNYLRKEGREDDWTAFQGELYGPGMQYAVPYEGAVETMRKLVQVGYELVIVSHRSRRPYAGRRHDLHAHARSWVAQWLQRYGLFGAVGDEAFVHFLETRDQKLEMINYLRCVAFVDDLPEVLGAQNFPKSTSGILFDPDQSKHTSLGLKLIRIKSWSELPEKLEGSRKLY